MNSTRGGGRTLGVTLRRGLSRLRYPSGLRPCVPAVELTRAYGPQGTVPEVLILGDSVSIRVSRDDMDATDLGRMIGRELPSSVRSCVIAQDGYHAGVFTALTRLVASLPHQPKVLIATINLRSCSPQWALNPLWQFDETIKALENYAADPDAGVPRLVDAPPTIEQQMAYLTAPACHPGRDEKTVGDFVTAIAQAPVDEEDKLKRLRTIFSFHYGFALDDTNRRLHDFRALAQAMRALDAKAFLYVTPVNHEGGTRLLGPRFADVLSSHVDAVFAACRADATAMDDLDLEDWSTLLPAGSFFHSFEPSDHLNEHGRRVLAAHVVRRGMASEAF